jgi:uncharacterized protein (TIGR00725 family)
MLRKLPIVAVFGAGTPIDAERAELARGTGGMIARLGAHLLTGAGYGVMAAAAEGFVAVAERAGWSIGIVPREPGGAFDEPNRDLAGRRYPNPYVEIAIHTPLPPRAENWRTTPARNHINVLSADAIVALPGGVGTHNELDMVPAYRDRSGRPPDLRRTVLLGPPEEFSPEHRARFLHFATLSETERHLRQMLGAQAATLDAGGGA